MSTKLEILKQITIEITNNFEYLLNSAKNSEISKIIDDTNLLLIKQEKLLEQTDKNINITNNKLSEANQKIFNQINNSKELKNEFKELLLINNELNAGLNTKLKGITQFAFNKKTELSNLKKQNLEANLLIKNMSQINKLEVKNIRNKLKEYDKFRKQYGLSHLPQYIDRAEPDLKYSVALAARTLGPQVANGVFELMGIIPIVGKGIELGGQALVKISEESLEIVSKLINLINQFGDKLEEYVGNYDEAIKSTIQEIGLIGTRAFGTPNQAKQISDNILRSSGVLIQQIGLAYSPENIAEFQKAYSELSKTTVAFNFDDYITIGKLQTITDLSSSKMGEITNRFIEMGLSVSDVEKYFVNTIENATRSGIQTNDIFNDIDKLYKASRIFRFRGGVEDLSEMQAYAKRIKVDIEGMFNLMDRVQEPEAAIDLAAQLSALDTVFLDLDPFELLGASFINAERFNELITEPLREKVESYFDIKTGQFTQQGQILSRGLLEIDGLKDVFKSMEDLRLFFAKAAKEKEVEKLISTNYGVYQAFINFSDKQQDQIIAILAQEAIGNFSVIGKEIKNLTAADLNTILGYLPPTTDIDNFTTAAAQGQISVKDQIETNEALVGSMMMTSEILEEVYQGLSASELKEYFEKAGTFITDVGLATFENEYFRGFEILTDYTKLSPSEAFLLLPTIKGTIDNTNNLLAEMLVSFTQGTSNFLKTYDKIVGKKGKKHSQDVGGDDTSSANNSMGGVLSEVKVKPITLSKLNKQTNNLKQSISKRKTNITGPGSYLVNSKSETKVIVSGRVDNYVNGVKTEVLNGEKIYEILKEHIY